MWPFKKHTDTTEAAKTAMYVDRPIDAATKTAMELKIGVPLASDVDQSRFAREERSTPDFHLNNINEIIGSLLTMEDGIKESIAFEETRHNEEMTRLQTNLANVSKSIEGYAAARAVLKGKTPLRPAPVDPDRMTAVGERIAAVQSERVKIGDFIDLEGEQYQIVPKNTAKARRVRLDGRYHWISAHTFREPDLPPAATDAQITAIPNANAPDKR